MLAVSDSEADSTVSDLALFGQVDLALLAAVLGGLEARGLASRQKHSFLPPSQARHIVSDRVCSLGLVCV